MMSLEAGADTVRKIFGALEAAGVEFTNGGQPGVRLRAEEEIGATAI